jgi:hypothetical protein
MKKLPKPHALAVQEWLDGKFITEIQINNTTMSVLSGKMFYWEYLVELPLIKRHL